VKISNRRLTFLFKFLAHFVNQYKSANRRNNVSEEVPANQASVSLFYWSLSDADNKQREWFVADVSNLN